MSIYTSLLGVAIAVTALVVYEYTSQKARKRLPPGPRPLPLVGNVNDMPMPGVPEFQHWLKHKDLYGPISSVTVLGTTIVIVHDRQAVHDLLDKAAGKTSGRPSMTMAGRLCGYENIVLCQQYTPTFRRCRKLLHQELGTKASAAQFRVVQEEQTKRQLVRALNEPSKWREHFIKTTGSVSLKTTYGYQVEPQKPDAVVSLINKMMTNFSFAAAPGTWLVDLVPALQHLPENFPAAGFKKTARLFRKDVDDGVHIPYHFARRQMADQNGKESFVSRLIRQCGLDGDGKGTLSAEDEHAIVWSAASLYGAAADTSVITLIAFTLAMIQFPEVQRKAQEEIDAVVGTDRLPTFDDQEKLPYINAVIKEALRWWPIAPMGFPHTADAEVEYGNYRIPKGALILPAVWWFMHDPQVYANPDCFEPERFMEPRNELDPTTEAFGYGRRICPGRFYAEGGLFLNMAYSLACFNIKKAIGSDGREIMPEVKASPGVLHHLTKFPFRIEPRSEKHVEMIKRIELDLPAEEGDTELLGLAET